MKRQHPIKILNLVSKNFWLLLIPLVRGLFSLRFDIYHWLQGAWLDLLVVLAILGIALLRWSFVRYEIRSDSVFVRQGILLRQEFTLPFSALCAALGQQKLVFRPFKAVEIFLDTNAGSASKADLQLTISRGEWKELLKLLRIPEENVLLTSCKPSRGNLFWFSFLFSSTLSGIIFISTLLIQSSKILGTSLENQFIVAVADATHKVAPMLPPIAAAISILLAAGWLFSFVSNLLRYLRFSITRRGQDIRLNYGFFSLRSYHIDARKINYADLSQNLLSKLFSVMSLRVSCSGYGKHKNETPVFLPITTKKQVYTSLKLLLPGLAPLKRQIRPNRKSFGRYVWLPFYASLIIPAAGILARWFFPQWESLILFLTVMVEIPFLWLLAVKTASFFSAGAAFDETQLCIAYSFGYQFHKVLIPRERICKATVTQSIFQRVTKACDLKIYATNEFTKCHRIIALPKKETEELLKKLGFSENEENPLLKNKSS